MFFRRILFTWIVYLFAVAAYGEDAALSPGQDVIVVVGAPGESLYMEDFKEAAGAWEKACADANASFTSIGLDPPSEISRDRENLYEKLALLPRDSAKLLWIVFLGHGTYSKKKAKFNLRGPDITARDLQERLDPFTRPTVIINCSSCSGAFLSKLSREGRVVITATKNGREIFYSRFSSYLAKAIVSPEADLDESGNTSLLEAFLLASRNVQGFYDAESRVATEHALFDDNGDGKGSRADHFAGLEPKDVKEIDGLRTHQIHLKPDESDLKLSPEARLMRDELELQVLRIRRNRSMFNEDEYYETLEKVLLKIAKIYESAGAL